MSGIGSDIRGRNCRGRATGREASLSLLGARRAQAMSRSASHEPARAGAVEPRSVRQRRPHDADRVGHRRRTHDRRARRLYRRGFSALGRIRQDAADPRPFGRGRDRADADQRRGDLRLQVRQRPSEERRGRPADGHGLRRALPRRQRLSDADLGNDDPDRAAHGRDVRACGQGPRAAGGADDGDHRQRRAMRVPGGRLQGALRRRGGAALRHRSAGDAQGGGEPRWVGTQGRPLRLERGGDPRAPRSSPPAPPTSASRPS